MLASHIFDNMYILKLLEQTICNNGNLLCMEYLWTLINLGTSGNY